MWKEGNHCSSCFYRLENWVLVDSFVYQSVLSDRKAFVAVLCVGRQGARSNVGVFFSQTPTLCFEAGLSMHLELVTRQVVGIFQHWDYKPPASCQVPLVLGWNSDPVDTRQTLYRWIKSTPEPLSTIYFYSISSLYYFRKQEIRVKLSSLMTVEACWSIWSGERIQWLRALAILSRYLGPIPST